MDEQWNRPSRSDQYLMQIAQEVRRVLSKDPEAIKLDHFKIRFELVEKKPTPKLTRSQVSKRGLARWVGMLTPKKKPPKKQE